MRKKIFMILFPLKRFMVLVCARNRRHECTMRAQFRFTVHFFFSCLVWEATQNPSRTAFDGN